MLQKINNNYGVQIRVLTLRSFYKKELKGKKVFICHGAQRALNYMGPIMDELGMEVVGVATYFANKENYEEIVKKLPKGAIIIDNPNTYELEKALMECVPDVFISDSKTKELVHKMGIPYINGRAPDTVYVGFDGFISLCISLVFTHLPLM